MGSKRSDSNNKYLSRRHEYAQKSCDVFEEPERREEKIMSYKHYDDCNCNECCHYHDKCDRCHQQHCRCKRRDDGNRFIEYDVDQSTTIFFPENNNSSNGGMRNPRHLNSLAQVRVDVFDENNLVELQGTVEWTPNDIPIIADLLTALLAGGISVPLSLEGTFRIYRTSKDGHYPVPIFETTDTSVINAIDVLGITTPTGTLSFPLSTVTTSFHFVDEDPGCGDNRYYLTLDLNLPNNPTVTVGGVTGLLSSFLPSLNFTSETRVFSATEIEDAHDHKKKY